MLTVRPLQDADAEAVLLLHGRAGPRQFDDLLAESQHAFGADGPCPQRHVFVLHDGAQLLGVAALAGSIGVDVPRYSFRVGVVVHASSELKLFNRARTLLLGNDLTACSELCMPLMASPDSGAAPERLLIDAMLLYVAGHRDRFADTLVAELPGTGYASGGSPFWDGLGRHFHAGAVPPRDGLFPSAERSHLARLLPKHPLYTSFLAAQAEACIGQRALHARVAADALKAQGFRHRGQVNIFDAGPIVECEVGDCRSVRGSALQTLALGAGDHATPCLVAVSGRTGFCAALLNATLAGKTLTVARDVAVALQVAAGERARVMAQGTAPGPT